MSGKFLSNVYDPTRTDAKLQKTYSIEAMRNGPKAMEREWQAHLAWIAENVVGRPKACKAGTVEEMEEMGYVGIYSGN